MRGMLPSVVVGLPLLLTGCGPSAASGTPPAMRAADAKQALIRMLERTEDEDLQRFLEPLMKTEGEAAEEGKFVDFGPWRCSVQNQTFVLSVTGLHGLLECSGSFAWRPDGVWVAKVERKRQT